MEDLVETLTRGNVTEVKVVVTTVALALAVYQLVLITVVYGKARPRFLGAGPAAQTHRASGDAIAVLLIVVALMCASYFGMEDDATFHAITGATLLAVLALKVVIIRWWHAAGRFLPVLGVLLLLAATWASTAGAFLA